MRGFRRADFITMMQMLITRIVKVDPIINIHFHPDIPLNYEPPGS
jgi:hypothetical protein